MSDIVIKIDNLSKQYRLGTINHGTLKQDLQSWWARMRGKEDPNSKIVAGDVTGIGRNDYFWALHNISLEVARGDVVGIIGRNGAGKSTLLKILSRVTAPTVGTIKVKGRIASLLEVGTGFHPELTGRENVFLNGAILGMSRSEIQNKFDEIVAFAEIEQFIDTPVKRYSSGMYVRLAFAVAAHLEPEILIIDEVLAVGDTQFQRKCLGKMGDVAKGGRTVLFVSHSMNAVEKLCTRAILLNNGQIMANENTVSVIERYMKLSESKMSVSLADRNDRQGTGDIRFLAVRFQNEKGEDVNSFSSGQSIRILFDFENRAKRDLKNVSIAIGIDNHMGERIAVLSNSIRSADFEIVSSKTSTFELCIDRLPLTPNVYCFAIYCTVNGIVSDWIQNAGSFHVDAGDYYKSGKMPPHGQGNFLIDYNINPILKH